MSSSSSVPLHHVFPEVGATSERPRIPMVSDGRETHFFLSCEYARHVLTVALSDAEFGEAVALAGPSVVCSRPTPGQNIVDPPSPLHFGVHLASLQVGLRFPLHTAHLSVMSYYGVIPGQFSPTTHMFIAGFLPRCMHLGIRPFIDIFLHFFHSIRPGGSESPGYLSISQRAGHRLFEAKSYPDSFKGWRQKWVWVTSVDGRGAV
ncbi:unnamed protein product [Cuscuta europaea]|uniref:Transposase (putative) gypsy type domain-containing protein n=1 Tax=Cuscuta europaea TaxID=41803 RepID=A0A9P0Z4B4_CUSEU|nr:unnamed protein product [Cuscuta europaea]